MTVGRLYVEMSSSEWLYWQAFFQLENEERAAEDAARQRGSAQQPVEE